jgi:CheY-like chemotaxis protein
MPKSSTNTNRLNKRFCLEAGLEKRFPKNNFLSFCARMLLNLGQIGSKGGIFKLSYNPRVKAKLRSGDKPGGSKEMENKHILIVDDDIDLAAALEDLMVALGARVTVAYHGRDALAKIASSPAKIDLILSDYQMPEMNGLQLLEEVRKIPGPVFPFVVLSGNLNDSLMYELQRLGVDGTLSKPFELPKLRALMLTAMQKRNNAETAIAEEISA